MEKLPTHVATFDEPIPAPHGDRCDGPDMRTVPPVTEMLDDLDRFANDEDIVGYIERFRKHLDVIGTDLSVVIERDGAECLMVGSPCDSQVRHRSRWSHFLFEHMNREEERRSYLIGKLRREGRFSDHRPSDPRQTTAAIRNFLRHKGRILLDPTGQLEEGGGLPLLKGSPEEALACRQAFRAYFDVRRRWRSDLQIKRAVRMLGRRLDNGWIALDARP